jgi:hypothetical protein
LFILLGFRQLPNHVWAEIGLIPYYISIPLPNWYKEIASADKVPEGKHLPTLTTSFKSAEANYAFAVK